MDLAKSRLSPERVKSQGRLTYSAAWKFRSNCPFVSAE